MKQIELILKEGLVNFSNTEWDTIDPSRFMTEDEIVVDLCQHRLGKHILDTIKTTSREKVVVSFHFTLGMWIRNKYGLWNSNNPLVQGEPQIKDGIDYSPHHPDAVSGRIIEKVHDYISGASYAYDYAMEGL